MDISGILGHERLWPKSRDGYEAGFRLLCVVLMALLLADGGLCGVPA
jgi:hypothetical protein